MNESYITVEMTDEEGRIVAWAAEKKGMPIEEYVRRAVLESIEREITAQAR